MSVRFIFSLALVLAARAAETPPTDGRVVALPPFLVEEAKGPPWRYAEGHGFEVLSRCSEATTRRVIETQVRLHQLLGEILPESLRLQLTLPRLLIIYDRDIPAAASREVIAKLLGTGPALPGAAPAKRYGILPNLRLWDRDELGMFMIARDNFDGRQLALTRDYLSYLLLNRLPVLPSWFAVGFMSMYHDIVFEPTELRLKPMGWISAAQMEELRGDPKLNVVVTPLADILAGRMPQGGDASVARRWRAQTELFLRWALCADNHAHRGALWKFVERAAVEGARPEVFEECFGMDLLAAERAVAAYRPTAVETEVHFRPQSLSRPTALPLRVATPAELARIKGSWERLEIHHVKLSAPELTAKYIDQARRTLTRIPPGDERDGRLLAALGLCEIDAGDDAAARGYLEEAAKKTKTLRPRAAFELARLRFAEFEKQAAATGGWLSVEQIVRVFEPLFAARAQNPPLPEVYELVATVWNRSASPPTRGHLAVLDEGVRLFPQRASLILRAAELNIRHGFREDALALIEVGQRFVVDEAARGRLAQLRAQLEPAP
jgi:hypothetical protein